MNNFTFGNERHQYYETVAGGSAGPDHDGASAVQTHMTNSRLTDPGSSKRACRCGSTNFRSAAARRAGSHRGGDGVCPEITFLEPMRANANRRQVAPRGLPAAMTPFPAATGWSASTGQSRS